MLFSLSGVVIDRDGVPAADASVAVAYGPAPAADIAALTDDRGRFALPPLPAGHWRIRAHGTDGLSGSVVVVLPQTRDATITLARDPGDG